MKELEQHTLLIPGPTPVPPPVLRALSKPMISHRGSDMSDLHNGVTERLQQVFKTETDVITLASSGTGGMESAIANTLSPGDPVLCVSIGNFGERFVKICKAYGLDADTLEFEWGQAADPAAVAEKLVSGKAYKAVTFTHNETSTAVTNDTAALCAEIRKAGALSIIDCVSGMLCTEFRMDEWDCDVVVAGSQKAFMLPPGLAFVALSDRAWAAAEESKLPKFYFDLRAMRSKLPDGQTAYTPAVGLMFAADAALDLVMQEGVDAMIARHARLAEGVRAAVKALGLDFFMDEAHASNGLTAIQPPKSLEADALRSLLNKKYGVVFSGGQGKVKGQIFRIAHMGAVSETILLGALGALEMGLREMGYSFTAGASVAAATQAWA